MFRLPSDWIAPGLVVLAAFLLGGGVAWQVQNWHYTAKLAALEHAVETANAKAQAQISDIHTEFVVVKEKQKVAATTIQKAITTHVPTTLPLLPPAFRVLHDAATTGEPVDDSTGIDGDPVAPATVAKTVAGNYADCNYDKLRLTELQAILVSMGVTIDPK